MNHKNRTRIVQSTYHCTLHDCPGVGADTKLKCTEFEKSDWNIIACLIVHESVKQHNGTE